MQLFDGDFKARKGINLGGSSSRARLADKTELLKKAQREREQRERDRLLHRSANRIQAFFRGRTATGKARVAARIVWDQRVGSEWAHVQGSDAETAAAWLATTVAMFTFLYRPRQDEGRLALLSRMCLHRHDHGEFLHLPVFIELVGLMTILMLDIPLVALPFLSIDAWPVRLGKLLRIFMETIGAWDR
jgi:hypothetical protein